MEDIVKILFLVVVLALSLSGKFKSDRKPAGNTPRKGNPLPENWGGEPVPHVSSPVTESPVAQQPADPEPFIPQGAAGNDTHRSTLGASVPGQASELSATEARPADDRQPAVDVHDAEEVRRAIIWQAILKRPDV